MHTLFSAVARSFLRAFIGALIVYAYGILAAPHVGDLRLLGVAALLGSIAAGLRAIQVYVPQLTISHWLGQPFGTWADSFLRAFIGSLLITLPGALGAPNLHTVTALVVAAIVGAFTAGVRALQGMLTPGEHPAPSAGLPEPPRRS